MKDWKIGVLAFPDFEELDLVGPWEMFRQWAAAAEGPQNCSIVSLDSSPVTAAGGLRILPHITTLDCPQFDVLLVPGGVGTRNTENAPQLAAFIAGQAPKCRAILSVCTGSFLLHRAGLLSGKRATTHWAHLQALRDLGDVVVTEERFVRDGKIWTSAGVSAGIDLALAFIADTAGEVAAGRVQFGSEYYPLPKSYAGLHRHPKAPGYLQLPLQGNPGYLSLGNTP